MSEYWKSTPKYWCKHCKIFVRDTKLEKTNHEATPKHQGNLKRFLRDLHRGHEKDEKDKERARSEVARLDGLVSGTGSAGSSSASGFGRVTAFSVPKPQATPSQRKQQLAQLAEMGVSIPEEFRGEMAMAGEWQVTSERILEPDSGVKIPVAVSFGIQKRPAEEEEEEIVEAKKRRWGSAYRLYPADEDDVDLEALLNSATSKGNVTIKELKSEMTEEVKEEPRDLQGTDGIHKATEIKREVPDEESTSTMDNPLFGVKQEMMEQAVTGVIFKKRKTKNIRQK